MGRDLSDFNDMVVGDLEKIDAKIRALKNTIGPQLAREQTPYPTVWQSIGHHQQLHDHLEATMNELQDNTTAIRNQAVKDLSDLSAQVKAETTAMAQSVSQTKAHESILSKIQMPFLDGVKFLNKFTNPPPPGSSNKDGGDKLEEILNKIEHRFQVLEATPLSTMFGSMTTTPPTSTHSADIVNLQQKVIKLEDTIKNLKN